MKKRTLLDVLLIVAATAILGLITHLFAPKNYEFDRKTNAIKKIR